MTTGWSPPPPSVTDARRATSPAQTVPLNMRGATRVSAQVATQVPRFSKFRYLLPSTSYPAWSLFLSLGQVSQSIWES